MSEEWKDKLRAKLSDYEAPTADTKEALWEGIISQMNPTPAVPLWRRVTRYAALPAAAVVLALLGHHLLLEQEQPILTPVEQPVVAVRSTTPLQEPGGDVVPVESPSDREMDAPSDDRRVRTVELPDDLVAVSAPIVESQDGTPDPEQTVEEVREMDTIVDEVIGAPEVGSRYVPEPQDPYPHLRMTTHTSRGEAGRMSVSLYASNGPAPDTQVQRGYGSHFPTPVPNLSSASATPRAGEDIQEQISALNSVQETRATTEYSLPVRLGFALSYYLTDRLALQSGITATRLSTKVTTGTIKYRTQTDYRIYLLGVPLGVKYDVWDHNNLRVYGSVGGAMELRLSSHATTEYSMDASRLREPGVDSNMGGARILWSLKGAVGVSYAFNPHVGLYLEPGMTYYLDRQILMEATQMNTPWVPTLTFGLNMSF